MSEEFDGMSFEEEKNLERFRKAISFPNPEMVPEIMQCLVKGRILKVNAKNCWVHTNEAEVLVLDNKYLVGPLQLFAIVGIALSYKQLDKLKEAIE